MFRFIWNSWWRNKERFLLLIVGALIVSIGLSYLVGISQASNATIVDELQKRWKSSYDIVVRPPDARSVTEELQLLEPNYLSGLSGGISLEQYAQIKAMDDIDVAAPIAMMGYIRNSVTMNTVTHTEQGIYRMNIKNSTNTGVENVVDEYNIYFTVGWVPPAMDQSFGVTRYDGNISYGSEVLIAGIDPEAEAALVGIDQAIVGNSYFTKEDKPETYDNYGYLETKLPVIISNQEFIDGQTKYTFERLDIPSYLENPSETMGMIKEQGGEDYLKTLEGEVVDQYIYTTAEVHQKIVDQVSEGAGTIGDFQWLTFKPSSVIYREVTSPYPDRWPFTYEVEPYMVPDDSLLASAIDHSYRPISMFGESSDDWPRLQLDFKGIFDPTKLDISKDPLTELPMETYFPSKADWVLDKNNQPVNPQQEMKPLNNPYGFLTKPPLMLTTLDAAAEVLGEQPISAIRIKVKGVEELNEDSEVILQQVAAQIEEQTGLMTDITLGSSPQPALTHIPGAGDEDSLGWVQQPWIKLGSSISIFSESKMGMSGVIASVIMVAMVYVFSSNIIMMYARKKEFAVLLAIGWRPNQLTKLLFLEATIIGLFVSIVSWLILGIINVIHEVETSPIRLLLIGLFGIAIYILGALIPGLLVRGISPYETMKTGEIAIQKRYIKTRSVFAMSINNLLAKWKRSILSIIAIALPTSLLIFFLFITFRLRGIMYTTWLGEYVAMEIGPMHYIAMGVAIAIAVLTTAEIIWQNVSESQSELAVLKAVGWENKTVRRLVLFEGALSGLIAGIIGVVIAYVMVWIMYGQFPYEQLPFFAATIILPIVTGILGAVLPAQKAVKIQPYQGLRGGYDQSKKTEKSFQYVFGITGVCLFLGIILLLAQAIPDVEKATGDIEQGEVVGTSGETKNHLSESENAKESDTLDEGEGSEPNSVVELIKTGTIDYRGGTYQQGENVSDESDLELYFGDLIEVPEENKMEILPDDKDYLTIPITFINKKPRGEGFSPNYYKLYSSDGIDISPTNSLILENNGWKSGMTKKNGGSVKWAVTYVIPKDKKEWFIVFNRPTFIGERLVKVNIDK